MADETRETQLKSQLEVMDVERKRVKSQLDRERLIRVTSTLIDTITAPGFVDRMRVARAASNEGKSYDVAADLLSLDGMRQAGVDIPQDFRLTSRVFEDKAAGVKLEMQSDPTPVTLPLPTDEPGEDTNLSVCGGAGTATFCACGGFSTGPSLAE